MCRGWGAPGGHHIVESSQLGCGVDSGPARGAPGPSLPLGGLGQTELMWRGLGWASGGGSGVGGMEVGRPVNWEAAWGQREARTAPPHGPPACPPTPVLPQPCHLPHAALVLTSSLCQLAADPGETSLRLFPSRQFSVGKAGRSASHPALPPWGSHPGKREVPVRAQAKRAGSLWGPPWAPAFPEHWAAHALGLCTLLSCPPWALFCAGTRARRCPPCLPGTSPPSSVVYVWAPPAGGWIFPGVHRACG